jgi:hypothetical protein
MNHQASDSNGCEFEINPFISDVARWLDCEVVEQKTAFKSIEVAERILRICSELHERDVATMTNFSRVAVWVPTTKVEKRLGNSNITTNPRLKVVKRDLSAIADEFQLAIREHAERRLDVILEYTEALFALCNQGRIKVIGTNSNGSYLWAPTLSAGKRGH